MGNSQSTDSKPAANSIPASPASSGTSRQPVARRRESGQGLSSVAARQGAAAPLSSTATSSPSPAAASRAQATSTHTRARSITSPTSPAPRLADAADTTRATSIGHDDFRPASRSTTLPPSSAHEDTASTSPTSQPVDVPASNIVHAPPQDLISSGMPNDESPYGLIAGGFARPPRLPLPIEEEAYTPGSPIISPDDITAPLDEKEVEEALPRRTSVLSSTTVDDDEIGEHDLYQGDTSGPTVPTVFEWKGPGDKVFVTGTFVQWERKFKLHRDKKTGIFSVTLQLKPGTHHVKFLVDDDMVTSNDLPVTVDFTNILVNYIEIVAPYSEEDEAKPADEVPGTAFTAGQAEGTDQPAAQPILIRETKDELPSEPVAIPASVPRTKPASPTTKPADAEEPAKEYLPRLDYTREIPSFLLDLDRYNTPEDERFQRASRVAQTLPNPPTLPLILSKSILNSATPHKDDASVLVMPNHTVLNHLATSSIRSGVLATSGTTRYKRKFLTTIMYRPTSDDG